jgi:acyl-homoserine-lactone acylase
VKGKGMKRKSTLLLLLTLSSLSGIICHPGQPNIYPESGKVRIITDKYGVPHIFASQETDAMYGQGFCHAANRLKQIFTSKLTAAGRLSEILGKNHLEQDYTFRLFFSQERISKIYSTLKPGYKNIITAYCKGVNDYILANRANIPEWIDQYEPHDLLSVSLMLNGYFPLETLTVIDMNNLKTGSNQFAVAANRSANGHAMMAFDPHMSFTGPFAWMEAHISTPEMSIVGCTIPGMPVVVMGHNGHTAWSSTKNGPDITDVYAFQINPQNPLQYKGPDGWMTFTKQDQFFKYKTADGTKEIKKEMKFTHVGPVLKIVSGLAYAGRVAGFDSPGLLEQMVLRSKAKSVHMHLQTYRIPGMCMMNIMAADTKGNIGYLDNAILPIRDRELDWSQPLDGADPRSEWKGIVSFEELPKVINPPSGWLQNCNDPAWTVTTGDIIQKENLPFRLASGSIGVRGQRISELLSGNNQITFDDMLAYAKDTEIQQAKFWAPRLISAYEKYKKTMSLEGTDTEEAIQLLKDWDYRSEPESKCMALFYDWYKIANVRRIVNDSQISEDIIKMKLKNLNMAAARIKNRYGRLDIPWGEILHLRHGDMDVPVSGGGGLFPVIKLAYGTMNQEHKIPVTMGSSYMMVVEMSPTPKAYSCFPIGINENPESKHFADMTLLYSKMQFKPVYFTWEELKPNIESNEILVTENQ